MDNVFIYFTRVPIPKLLVIEEQIRKKYNTKYVRNENEITVTKYTN